MTITYSPLELRLNAFGLPFIAPQVSPQVSEKTLRAWIYLAENSLSAARVGRKILVRSSDLEHWLSAHRVSVDIGAIADEIVAQFVDKTHGSKTEKTREQMVRGRSSSRRTQDEVRRDSRAVAEKVRRTLEERLAIGELGFFENEPQADLPGEKPYNLEEYANKFFVQHAEPHCKPSTVSGYRQEPHRL
jgi:hypothetical protein